MIKIIITAQIEIALSDEHKPEAAYIEAKVHHDLANELKELGVSSMYDPALRQSLESFARDKLKAEDKGIFLSLPILQVVRLDNVPPEATTGVFMPTYGAMARS